MKLNALPRRDPQRAVRMAVGEPIEGEILIGGEPPAGDADAHHELPHLAFAALLQFGRAVAIISLIDAVEFEQRVTLLVERVFGVDEVAGEVAAQMPALLLDRLGL